MNSTRELPSICISATLPVPLPIGGGRFGLVDGRIEVVF